MSDRMEFYAVRNTQSTIDDCDCLTTTEESAEAMLKLIEQANPENKYVIDHVEVAAYTDLSFQHY